MRVDIRVRPLGSAGAAWLLALLLSTGCGGRTLSATPRPSDAGPDPAGDEVRCDGLDDDGDGDVDEGFRDGLGRYLHAQHCGACGQSCGATIAHATEQGCGLIDDLPRCVAQSCEAGFGPTLFGTCTELDTRLCLPCVNDGDCGTLVGAACLQVGGEQRCSRPCAAGCPQGYVCEDARCEPQSGSCACESSAASFELACHPPDAPEGCAGRARCESGVQSACLAPEEGCDGEDDDCDGRIDETFIDELGSYSLSDANCGACGIACTADDDAGLELTCGGDPFSPSCVTACPDLADGVVNVGDRLDANRVLGDGCECVVRSLADAVGKTADEPIDTNCDGADGSVLSSFYVSIEGDDAAPGSPTRPLRTIDVAIERAADSLNTGLPRPHVFVASGVYLGTVHLRDGVQLHGGFRGDFLAQSDASFEVIVIADAGTDAPGGAALLIEQGAGSAKTLVEGITFRGRDAQTSGEPAVAVVIDHPSGDLTLRDLRLRTGQPADGLPGDQGDAGRTANADAEDGDPQRAALENAAHQCLPGSGNVVRGGDGGHNVCADGVDVAGGRGGDARCPEEQGQQQSGDVGQGVAGVAGGLGGVGGEDVVGPIEDALSCAGVCCGLADFSVPSQFTMAQPGSSGTDGRSGTAGGACTSALGTLDGSRWVGNRSSSGRSGTPGGGGGGGGAGSGALMNWMASVCEFADGLGGAGGGGGAGGCGGGGGAAGQSGGASIGIVLRVDGAFALPTITGLVIETEPAGAGGAGGAGGDGGLGRSGGFGGAVDDEDRSTPTLAGPMPGQRGGKGGRGGSGGGGGGGCGGPSVGLWVSGAAPGSPRLDDYRDDNEFELGAAGDGGLGGSGGVPAAAGSNGMSLSVVVQ